MTAIEVAVAVKDALTTLAGRAVLTEALSVDEGTAYTVTVDALPVTYAGTYPYTLLRFAEGHRRVVVAEATKVFSWQRELPVSAGATVEWSTGPVAGARVKLGYAPPSDKQIIVWCGGMDEQSVGLGTEEGAYDDLVEGQVICHREVDAETVDKSVVYLEAIEMGEQARDVIRYGLPTRFGRPRVGKVRIVPLESTTGRDTARSDRWIYTASVPFTVSLAV